MSASPAAQARVRVDVWLWRARFFKTRGRAAAVVEDGIYHVRHGQGRRIDKPSFAVQPGDGLTFAVGRTLMTVAVMALGERRGPAAEARALYSVASSLLDGDAEPAQETPPKEEDDAR